MKTIKEEKIINDLLYYKDLKIVQNKNYFNFSLDSVLLPNFVIINPNTKKILDLCTGNAPIPLILSTKTKASIIGIEIQKEIYDLAIESIKINKKDSIEIINKNAKDIINDYETDTFDIITCNPPYFKYTENSKINDNDQKTIARHEKYIKLEDILKISKKLLKNGGSLCMIHRTDRLIETIELFKKYNIEPKRIQLIYPKVGEESNMFLIEGRKNGNVGLKILPHLVAHKENGEYSDVVKEMFQERG